MTSIKVDVDQVLNAAAVEYAHRGYDGVSMRDIAARAGTSATALHYHFGSKDSLYREACGHAYETFILHVGQRLQQRSDDMTSPESLAGAMFDEWMADPTTLLLTDRDAVEALTSPERWLTAAHYPRMLRLIGDVHRRFLGHDADDDLIFAFAAMVFGYCSLMGIELRSARRIDGPTLAVDEAYQSRRRAALTRFSSRLWQL